MKDILTARKLSKKYFKDPNLGTLHGSRDIINAIFKKPPNTELRNGENWVVQDVNISLKQGETLGLIGTNGSGKSTTLKMLAGLILPSKGKVYRNGTIQSLINLGAGLNPNLNGIDNIQASAALLGFKKNEIKSVIEKVFEFSELGDFMYNPINTYSSGMYARLGFSIAVNLRPEIMLIDEILAVGDYNFQNKCRIHLETIKREGTSIILVSHSNTHIAQICENALWLHKGKSISYGPSQETLKKYMEFLDSKTKNNKKSSMASLYGPEYQLSPKICDFKVKLNQYQKKDSPAFESINSCDPLKINFSFNVLQSITNVNISLCLYREDGLLIFAVSSLSNNQPINSNDGQLEGEFYIPRLSLAPGNYKVVLPIHEGPSYLFRGVIIDLQVKGLLNLNKGIVNPDYTFKVQAT